MKDKNKIIKMKTFLYKGELNATLSIVNSARIAFTIQIQGHNEWQNALNNNNFSSLRNIDITKIVILFETKFFYF